MNTTANDKRVSMLELDPSLEGQLNTPPLDATADPSPLLERIVSPALEDGDKAFDLDAPSTSKKESWRMPECWGHRGASASYPENTLMSFIQACNTGADGIETDIHMTSDDQLVLFHDPNLERTSDGKGMIHTQPWHGVLEHVRTTKTPRQPIPLFSQLLEILMLPANRHVKLNIDCKVENDPVRLFTLIKGELDKIEGWEKTLGPRLILGLWHPKFVDPAVAILPHLRRFCISMSIPQVRKYFYDKCDGFSVWYAPLTSTEGAKFRAECAAAGKEICTWTVNNREDMLQCARWGIFSIISDKPELWREIKRELEADRARALKPTLQTYILPYLEYQNYWFEHRRQAREELEYLEREGGKFDAVRGDVQAIRPGDFVSQQP